MDYTKLTYRFLESNELEKFLNLQDSSNMWMGSQKDEIFNEAYGEIKKKLFLSPLNKTVGGFDEQNNLVASSSGIFPPNNSHWYSYGQAHTIKNTSLSSGIDSFMIWMNSTRLLQEYAESKNYFSFYNYRSVKHQKTIDKLRLEVEKRNIYQRRYESYWEYIYSPGENSQYNNHKFYFPKDVNYTKVDTVVVLYTLKPEIRDFYLNKSRR